MFKYQSKRKYHVYKMAGDVLKLFESDVQLKQNINQTILDKSFQRKLNTAQLFKQIRDSNLLKSEREIQEILDASKNIKKLCYDAYHLCKRVEENEQDVEDISDELVDFLELTNEMYPCVKKNLYQKIIQKVNRS